MSDKKGENIICGHGAALDFIGRICRSQRPARAYLVTGPEHVGKTTVAAHLSRSLLCLERQAGGCGDCFSCRQFDQANHPDLITLQRLLDDKTDKFKTVISVDQIRDNNQLAQQSPLVSKCKVIVIEAARDLNANAANALLKSIEDANSKAIYVFVATHPEWLLPTIVSRCQQINLAPVPVREIEQCLIARGWSADLAHVYSHWSLGLPGLALAARDEDSEYADYLTARDRLDVILASDRSARLVAGQQLINWSGQELVNRELVDRLCRQWIRVARDGMIGRMVGSALVADVSREVVNPAVDWSALLAKLTLARDQLTVNINSKHIFQYLILSL